jgi:hypothetical protein|tara:strand:- start:137 stop:835 length:699 start_codon:yes stop_codon:yes gene_type:complete
MSKVNVNTIEPSTGTDITLGASGDTITVPSGATFTQSGTMNASAITAGTMATARLGSGTASSTTILYGDQTYKTEPAAGLTVVDQWRVNATFSGDADPIASNWEQVDTSGQGTLGSAMTESSGIFTFPSTGIYLVRWISNARAYSGNSETGWEILINVTINDSAYACISESHQCGSGSNSDLNAVAETLVDVTDVANVKVSFGVDAIMSNTMMLAGSTKNDNSATFIRVGDT